MKRKRNSLCIFLFLFEIVSASFSLSGQERDEYKFRTVNLSEILGLEGVVSIAQDGYGFMWVIVPEEILRYDGLSIKRYSKKITEYDSEKTVSQVYFRSVFRDSSNDLYLASTIGVFQYDAGTDRFQQIYSKTTYQIEEDAYGKLWFVGDEIGIYDKITKKAADFRYANSYNTVLCIDDSANVFFGADFGKISLITGQSREIQSLYSFPESTKLVALRVFGNQLWILTETKGLYVLDIQKKMIVKKYDFFLQNNNRIPSKCLFIDNHNNIWIGTQQGLYLLNPKTGEQQSFFQSKDKRFGIDDHSIRAIVSDDQGNIWIGTSQSVCFLPDNDQNTFHPVFLSDYLFFSNRIPSFAQKDNDLWIGTDGGGLFCYKKQEGVIQSYLHDPGKNSLKYNNIKTLLFHNPHLWIGMYKGGIDRLDVNTGQFKNFSVTDFDRKILCDDIAKFQAENDSGMWIIYQSIPAMLTYFSFEKEVSQHYFLENTKNNTLEDNRFFDICRDNNDRLWLVSATHIILFDIRERQYKQTIDINEQIQTKELIKPRYIFFDNKRAFLWIGTKNNGLIKYDTSTGAFKLYDSVLKFGHVSMHSIMGDGNGNIWMGSNMGLLKFDVEKEEFFYYNQEDAISDLVHPVALMDTDHLIYLGTAKGFYWFDPTKIKTNEIKPRILMEDFLINNQSIYADSVLLATCLSNPDVQKIKLAYNQNNIGINLSCTNYLMPTKNRFKYRLRGYDEAWIEVDASQRCISYPRLPSGNYIFEAIAANNDGIWGDVYQSEISIAPAPWNSLPAWTGYFILIFTGVYYFYRNKLQKDKLQNEIYLAECRKKDQEENHQSLLRFFTNITHEFKTPLTILLGTLDYIEKEEHEIPQNHLHTLRTNSEKVLKLVNEIIDFRKIENGMAKLRLEHSGFNDLVRNYVSGLREYAFYKNITLKVRTDPAIPENIWMDAGVIEKIISNLLNNAIKYTSNQGFITLETCRNILTFKSSFPYSYTEGAIAESGEMFGLVIHDTGCGISQESISKVFTRFYRVEDNDSGLHLGSGIGLAYVRSLVLLHNGFITIASERGVGTDFVVGFPLLTVEAEKEKADETAPEVEVIIADESAPYKLDLPTPGTTKQYHILYVEDNEEVRQLVSSFLSPCFDLTVAANGAEALALLSGKSFDLIVSDWVTPVMDGITFCRNVKQNPEFSHIPFILLTVRSGADNRLEGCNAGAEIYLEKPIDFRLLLSSIYNLLRLRNNFRLHFAENYFMDTSDFTANKTTNDTLQEFTGIIQRKITSLENIDFDEIAKEMKMSRRKLFDFVKGNTGNSIIEFVRICRIRLAAKLMIEENLPVKEAMFQVGIESRSYFNKIFKIEFGDTPSDFFNKMRAKNRRFSAGL